MIDAIYGFGASLASYSLGRVQVRLIALPPARTLTALLVRAGGGTVRADTWQSGRVR